MSKAATLWHAAFRKESLDLLTGVWPSLNSKQRRRLATHLLRGPSDELLAHIAEADRTRSRDRRIFERLAVVERVASPRLPAPLARRLSGLRNAYPGWEMAAGERGHFNSWVEIRWGTEKNYSVDDLVQLSQRDLIGVLVGDQDKREGLLESWRQFCAAQPKRGFDILKTLARRSNKGPVDLWSSGLGGLRDSKSAGDIGEALLSLLVKMPDRFLEHPEIIEAVSDILQAFSRGLSSYISDGDFFNLMDRTIDGASNQTSGIVASSQGSAHDWVLDAINHPLGRLATALMNAIFAARLKVNEGIPGSLLSRLNRMMKPKSENYRAARVIGASRLAYLYAVDPRWTELTLLPRFDWSNEAEAVAMWQGYAWQATVDKQLWIVLKTQFYALFRASRIAALGDAATVFAELMMVVGVVFGKNEFTKPRAQRAVREMTEDMRVAAAAWISNYVKSESSEEERSANDEPDLRWVKRVAPWVEWAWPLDPGLRSERVSNEFALAAIATKERFPEAVRLVRPYLTPTDGFMLLHDLVKTEHPERYPRSVLELLTAAVAPERIFSTRDVAQVFARIVAVEPGLVNDSEYRRFHPPATARGGEVMASDGGRLPSQDRAGQSTPLGRRRRKQSGGTK